MDIETLEAYTCAGLTTTQIYIFGAPQEDGSSSQQENLLIPLGAGYLAED